MKRERKRYVLLSFSSQPTTYQKAMEEVGEAFRSKGIRAWPIHYEPGILVYRCLNRSIDCFRSLFPMVLSNNECIAIKGVSGTIRALRRKFMS